MDSRFRGRYLNGGTTLWRGRLWHLVEVVPGTVVNELADSVDGLTWHHVAWLPTFSSDGAKVAGADFSLVVERGELVASMFLVHTRPLGSAFALGRVHFDGRRWHSFETILRRDASMPYEAYDVGEPEVFKAADGETAMLYGATAADKVRSIAMAILRHGRGVRCGNNLSFAPEPHGHIRSPSTRRYFAWGRIPTSTTAGLPPPDSDRTWAVRSG